MAAAPPPESAAKHRRSVEAPIPSDFIHGTFKGEPSITIPQDTAVSLAARFNNTLIGHEEHSCTVKYPELQHTFPSKYGTHIHKEFRPKGKMGENSVHTIQEGIILDEEPEHLPRHYIDKVKEMLVGSSSHEEGVGEKLTDESMTSKKGKTYSDVDACPEMLSLRLKEDMPAIEPNAAAVDTPGMQLSELHCLDSAPTGDKVSSLETSLPAIVPAQMKGSAESTMDRAGQKGHAAASQVQPNTPNGSTMGA